MKHVFGIALCVSFAKIALCCDIFRDLTSPFEPAGVLETADVRHGLLIKLGEHLLSNNEQNNLLSQVFVSHRGNLENLREKLETLLKPFADKKADLAPKINWFIEKTLSTTYPLTAKTNLTWNDIKPLLPTLQILCKQLIDQVR